MVRSYRSAVQRLHDDYVNLGDFVSASGEGKWVS